MRNPDQRRLPLPADLTEAERDFFLELRRLIDVAGFTCRALEELTSFAKSAADNSCFYSKSQWGRWLNAQSMPPRKAVKRLAETLAREDINAEQLVDLWETTFVAANPEEAGQSEADFLIRYRRHVAEHHGMLEPPDFERRRRVPIADLYVPPAIVQIIRASRQFLSREVTLQQFGEEIDRTVLLGDPGSGKTTAAQVLMHDQATQPDGRVPFIVTLREFAAAQTAQRSVAGHLQDKLETFYQCPAPAGAVERLLFSGAALVIFDGLDELADTTRRGDVTAIIERFCAEYPLAPVLVTSRLVGYDQARLDDRAVYPVPARRLRR